MKVPKSILLSLLPFSACTSTNPQAPLAPPSVTIDSFIYNGSGCPQGSLDATVSRGGTQISVSYSQMVAYSPNESLSAKRKFCQFNFKLHYPPGWALTVVGNEFDGYVNVDAGMTAEVVSSYYFSGEGGGESDPSTRLTINGPYNDDYRIVNPTSAQVWSPCGAEVLLNLKTDIRLIGNGGGLITADRQKTKFFNFVNLDWRQC